jgi:hypothetical protein
MDDALTAETPHYDFDDKYSLRRNRCRYRARAVRAKVGGVNFPW